MSLALAFGALHDGCFHSGPGLSLPIGRKSKPLSGSAAGAFAVLNWRTFMTLVTTESGVRRGFVSVGVETATC